MNQRTIVLFIAISLDGYIASEDGSIGWLDQLPLVEKDDTYLHFYQQVGTAIMGRTTYDQIITDLSPAEYPYRDIESIVLTSREGEKKEGVTFVNQDIITLVTDLKGSKGKDVWIVGGQSVINPLMEAELIDSYIIAIAPIVLGEGISLFGKLDKPVNLQLKESFSLNQLTYLILEKNTTPL